MTQRDLGVLLFYVLLTLALTWPLPLHMNEYLSGDDSDVYINPWANWWTKEALSKGLDFYHTNYLFYPQGTSLVFHSFSHTNTTLSLLLTPLMGRFAAHNATILLAYALSGFSMYLLVRHLTDSRYAGFVAGLVFAFHPYHIFESAHPNLIATQGIPLFALALDRLIYDKDTWYKQSLLGGLWFFLTALSGWHLMMLLAGWTFLYVLYGYLFERTEWSPRAFHRLLLLGGVITLSLAPFVWPIFREHLTAEVAYAIVDVDKGLGNDLLSFFIPNKRHPCLSHLFSGIHDRIGYARRRPAYLGYTALALAGTGIVGALRKTRFWLLTGLIFCTLSLGPQIRFNGTPIHTFDLPWAIPIVNLLRHPYRFNILIFPSLAVLVGFGARRLYSWVSTQSELLTHPVMISVTVLLLFEYLVYPFPTTEPSYSPFLRRLAEEERDFAVTDFPMGRQPAKYYMFFQTIHGKKIVDGFSARTPDGAYAFVASNPLLGPLRAGHAPDADLNIERAFAGLAAQDIRYIILHKRFIPSVKLAAWRRWLADFPPPFYEDDWLIVYRTLPDLEFQALPLDDKHRLDVQIGDHIRLLGYQLSTSSLSARDTLTVTLFWRSDGQVSADYRVFVHLLDSDRKLVVQHDGIPMWGQLPTWSWWAEEVIRDEHMLPLAENLPSGIYELSVGMYDARTQARVPALPHR